ncbi:hypothetical protein CPC08DRAFT_296439 [Agrocybe pediades]|nr:hypothetical protein CPC08DRAFT_296439 [Agrocybe pediades]
MSTDLEDFEKTMHTLKRLSDPFIANRVKKLDIQFHYTEPVKPFISHRESSRQGISKRFKYKMRRPAANGVLSTSRAGHDEVPPPCSWPELISRIIWPECRNLNELRLDWMVIPSSYSDKKAVLSDLWARSPAGPNLKALFLSGDLAFYQAFTETMPPFPQLATLRIQYDPDYYAREQELLDDSPVLLSHVIPFIKGVSLTIQHLCIRNLTTLVGLSAFLTNFPVLPVLQSLSILLYVDWSPVGDTDPLYLFLDGFHSNTLRYLDLGLHSTADKDPEEEDMSSFLLRLFTSPSRSFINLQSLTLYPTITARSADIVIAVLQKTRRTLQKLCVQDEVTVTFNIEELGRIFDTAAGCRQLTYLGIHIVSLDWIVLDMLAERAPRLRTLAVVANRRPIFCSSREERLREIRGDGTNVSDCLLPTVQPRRAYYVRNLLPFSNTLTLSRFWNCRHLPLATLHLDHWRTKFTSQNQG